VLARRLAEVHPDWTLTVLVLDDDPPADEPFETAALDGLELRTPGLLELTAGGPRQLALALRPHLMATLAARPAPVIWLDPTVRPLGRLDALLPHTSDELVLVPLHGRLERPVGLGVRGPYESGAVGCGDVDVLRWWAELVDERARATGAGFDCGADDLLGALAVACEQTRIVRERGICAGWWTLAAGGRVDGEPPELDGEPLAALNLAGFDPRRPHWTSSEDGHGLAPASGSPTLAGLLADHAHDLQAAGWDAADGEDWRYACLPGGLAVDDDLRDLYALAAREGAELGDPFTPDGCAAFLDWIAGDSPVGDGVSWYLQRVHARRADLQEAFPDLVGGDARRLAEWMREFGAGEEPVLATLLARGRERPGRPAPSVGNRAAHGGRARVRLVGYLREGLGLGEAARAYGRALTAAGIAAERVGILTPLGSDGDRPRRRRLVDWDGTDVGAGEPPEIEIVCVNAPELLRMHRAGAERPEGAYRIGVWAWELEQLPAKWAEAFPLVDEIWVYSEHGARALREAPVPVEVMPLALDVDRLAAAAERTAAVGEREPFTFVFMFDLLSSLERKNPLGLIAAFRRAFDPGEGPRLVIKTSNGDNRPEPLERLRVAAIGRPDIEVVDEFLAAEQRDELVAGCDCYVSLHRAEGFGLTPAEAMAAGRPVIATAYSGNLDFMTKDTAHLVGWRPAEVEAGSLLYPAGARWAEPDLDAAATLMRRVATDRARARALGAAGREHVRALLSPAVVGERVRARIEAIEAARPRRGSRASRRALTRWRGRR
jgi:glycosyltransferase involved in cell wall biosynthesis